jgi:L-amino acid N-acyltransferase YncA
MKMNHISRDLTFRTAELADTGRLLEIYAPYVRDTAITFEYEVPSLEEFTERIRHTLERYPYIVAEQDGKILGYAYVGPFHERAAYDWAVETSIYVDRNVRHSGVGRGLYDVLEKVLRAMHILNLNACIAYPREADEHLTKNSAEFHAHLGYRLVGEFHECGYKFGRWYDMIWMEKLIGEHTAHPEAVEAFPDVREKLVGTVLRS